MPMRTRLTSLVLLLVLAGSAFAGIPLHFGESECSMGDAMAGIDCCKAALMEAETAQSAAARLCCALNCLQNGSTAPSNIVRVSPPSQAAVPPHPAIAQALLNSSLPLRYIDRAHGPPVSTPAYIRHLALLI
jgi:hypothetical protein